MTHYTRCPVVSRTLETFTSFTKVGGEKQKMTFERPVVWIQESESRIEFLHGGKLLKEGPIYSDYYGYLTSFQNRDDDGPQACAESYEVDQESSLEVRMVTVIHKIPRIETAEDRAYNLKNSAHKTRQYSPLPDDYRKELPSEHSPTGLYYPMLEKVLIVESVTWSSKHSAEQNLALASAFLEDWSIAPATAPSVDLSEQSPSL